VWAPLPKPRTTKGLLVPPEVVTVKGKVSGLPLDATTKVAVICVELTTLTLFTVIKGPALTVAPAMKFVPVSVTGTLVQNTPDDGLTDVSVGTGGAAAAA